MAVILRKAVASSSRRSVGNGHVESDPVEDDVADEPVRVRGKRVARAEDDGDEDEKEDGWTIDTFVDRAIEKSTAVIAMVIHLTFTDERPDAEQMKGVADRFKEVIKKVEDGMSRATDNAKAIEDASPDDDQIEELETGLQRGIEQRQTLQIKIEVLEQMQLILRQGETLADANGIFEESSAKRTEEYMAKTKRAKFKDVKEYIDFRTSIWEINHPNQACPPMSRFLPKSDADESDDDDFEMGGTTQNYRCPVTMLPFKDAVTSNICNHSYSRHGIEGIFSNAKRNKRSARCPVAGCNVELKSENLISDKSLQKRADEFEKRRARREEESDNEDAVDISQE